MVRFHGSRARWRRWRSRSARRSVTCCLTRRACCADVGTGAMVSRSWRGLSSGAGTRVLRHSHSVPRIFAKMTEKGAFLHHQCISASCRAGREDRRVSRGCVPMARPGTAGVGWRRGKWKRASTPRVELRKWRPVYSYSMSLTMRGTCGIQSSFVQGREKRFSDRLWLLA